MWAEAGGSAGFEVATVRAQHEAPQQRATKNARQEGTKRHGSANAWCQLRPCRYLKQKLLQPVDQ